MQDLISITPYCVLVHVHLLDSLVWCHNNYGFRYINYMSCSLRVVAMHGLIFYHLRTSNFDLKGKIIMEVVVYTTAMLLVFQKSVII